uniref:methylated diphthine methylhydrolase n=1 Tax=Heterorhabditis bacteriophora TaxID=37862 RepID=A0A1I7XSP6_HETBA
MTSSVTLSQRPAFILSNIEHLVVSTYQLNSPDIRSGAIYILSKDLQTLNVIPTTAGVFRFKWFGIDQVICALSDGSICIIPLNGKSFDCSLPVSRNMLLDVSHFDHHAVTTDNTGYLYFVDLETSSTIGSWIAHSLPYTNTGCEVWTCAIKTCSTVACTGGEDAALRLWDIRTQSSVSQYKLYDAGVTFSDWEDENTIISGSYDQKIRLHDIRNMKVLLKEVEINVEVLKTSGGVWNVEKTVFNNRSLYLAACMYGGWKLFNNEFNLLAENTGAGAELLYGASLLSVKSLAYTTFNDYKVTAEPLSCPI